MLDQGDIVALCGLFTCWSFNCFSFNTSHVSGIALLFFPWSWKLLSLNTFNFFEGSLLRPSNSQNPVSPSRIASIKCEKFCSRAMGDEQFRYLDGDRSHHTRVAGRDPIPSISEFILNRTPNMLTLTYSPSLYYPYKMVVRKLNLSADRNTCISSASVPAVA